MKLKSIKSFTILLSLLFSTSCSLINFKKVEKAKYILPNNFTGAVVIIFNQADGVMPDVEDDFTVYKIPNDGLLKVKTQAIYKVSEQKFFYEGSTGQLLEIKYVYPDNQKERLRKDELTSSDVSNDKITNYAMGATMGSFYIDNELIRFRSLLIGKLSNYEKLYLDSNEKISEFKKIKN